MDLFFNLDREELVTGVGSVMPVNGYAVKAGSVIPLALRCFSGSAIESIGSPVDMVFALRLDHDEESEPLASAISWTQDGDIYRASLDTRTIQIDELLSENARIRVYGEIKITTTELGPVRSQSLNISIFNKVWDGDLITSAIQGESAYQVAVANGFIGTELEWLESLNAPGFSSVQTITGTAYSLSNADIGKWLRFTSAAAVTITLPTQATAAWSDGAEIIIQQAGTGQVTIAPAGGVFIEKMEGATLKSGGQIAAIAMKRISSNLWLLTGQLEEL